ncbi:hypothetical protein BD414DRAFT_469290 [Trametes punicea]|nr:hypothetical protein BD414DRAFT_469290 [Trametes punicea]
MTSSNAPFLEKAAYLDAIRILQHTEPLPPVEPPPALKPPTPPPTTASTTASIDLDSIGEAEARKIVSEEHRALGFRPPDGSLAAQAQSAAARHPQGSLIPPDEKTLTEAAEADAVRVAGEMGGQPSYRMQHVTVPGKGRLLSAAETLGIDMRGVGRNEANLVMSEEHSELGYRPPAGSLAAEAQSAASQHPQGEPGVEHPDPISLVEAAREDAERVAAEREPDTVPCINIHTITKQEAQLLESLEHRFLGYTPRADHLLHRLRRPSQGAELSRSPKNSLRSCSRKSTGRWGTSPRRITSRLLRRAWRIRTQGMVVPEPLQMQVYDHIQRAFACLSRTYIL